MKKPTDKGSCMIVWDKTESLLKGKNILATQNTYKEVKFGDSELVKLEEESNRIFKEIYFTRGIQILLI